MSSTTLNLSIIEKRMLRRAEAANYSGLPAKYFDQLCPVEPVEIRPGSLLFDKRELDKWLDNLKAGVEHANQSSILAKLK